MTNAIYQEQYKNNKHYPLFVLLEQPEAAEGEIFI